MNISKRVLISGASGFIGKACVFEFLAAGWKVSVLLHKNIPSDISALRDEGAIDVLSVSLSDFSALKDALAYYNSKKPVDCIVNAAGLASDVGSREDFRTANYDTVRCLVDVMKDLHIGKLIHMSSTDVYGIKDFVNADEDTEYEKNPKNFYPLFKILSELYIKNNLCASQYVLLRPGAVWGPGDRTMLPRFAKFMKKSGCIVNFGHWQGKNRWPMAYVGNLSKAVRIVADLGTADGEAVNIIDREKTSFEEYQRLIADRIMRLGVTMKVYNVPGWLAYLSGRLSSFLTAWLKLKKPLWDPTFYAYLHISSNLDLSSERLVKLFHENGEDFISREEAVKITSEYYAHNRAL